ncbi:hypothetical protein J2Y69_003367 [Microbacterium resistens]|uniref:Uncharacterized protein n=1 Tax=Microbacterium resistens TaxID=156977 RepID=A0ABU1SHG5_9MICO|nr:hypothetical protein [Microbacterium resistens]MDR6868743.1 hypothetical protein [Microbacterium resistens]
MTRSETQPDDLAPGVYRDFEGDLWAVDRNGMAVVLTDRTQADLFDQPLIIPANELGGGIPADEAHAAYKLRLLLPF